MSENSGSRAANPLPVVIVGAGVSGLCAAHWLKKAGIEVLVLEKEAEAGGTMKTRREQGWLYEFGPNSALETTPLIEQLLGELSILDRRIYSHEAASRRYILKNGKLSPLPMDPSSFILSPLWSPKGKLRLLREPFIGRASEEESVADFVRRRLGTEFLDYAVNPFVSGMYAGDPEKLSVRSAFPKMYALESKHGGLFKGMLALRKERKASKASGLRRSKLFSLRDGMQTLPASIAASLGESLQVNAPVERIVPMRAGRFPVYTVSYRTGGKAETVQASAVILAAPAHAAAGIIRPIDPEMAKTLESIYYSPLAVAFTGFRSDQFLRTLDGFGYLVPEIEHRRSLGSIWSSVIFPGRAPEGCAALTTFLGGARQPELAALDDWELRATVMDELRPVLNIVGEPLFSRITRWERAIPQYNIGYHRVLESIDRFEQNYRGAFICANYRGGISVGDCIESAKKVAESVGAHINLSPSM